MSLISIVLAVDHFPVAGQDEIVSDPVDQRNDGLTFRQGRDGAALEAVAAVHHQRVLRILLSQRVDHRAQRGKPASALERRASPLVEELVVDLELRVNVGGVQNGEVLRFPRLHRLAAGQVGRRFAPAPAGLTRGPDPARGRAPSHRHAAGTRADRTGGATVPVREPERRRHIHRHRSRIVRISASRRFAPSTPQSTTDDPLRGSRLQAEPARPAACSELLLLGGERHGCPLVACRWASVPRRSPPPRARRGRHRTRCSRTRAVVAGRLLAVFASPR